MSESTRKTRPLLLSRRQARQLAAWAEGVAYHRELTRIVKQGRFAYFTDSVVVVRWDVEGLDVPDGSWIDLLLPGPGQRNKNQDALTNMAQWAQRVGKTKHWDLMHAPRWRAPDGEETLNYEEMFTRKRKTKTPVTFDLHRLTGLSLMVAGNKHGAVAMSPTTNSATDCWWVMGQDKRVAGLCAPMRWTCPIADCLPEAYQEKNKGGKQ